MKRCTRARCQWRPDPQLVDEDGHVVPDRDQLAVHAEEAGHPLCAVCARSLQVEEKATCEKCLTRARENLAEIVTLYALLPAELGYARSTAYDQDRRGAGDGSPLPGGDVLVLMAGGSNGSGARRLTTTEQLLGVAGREHGVDNQEDDAPSVPDVLARWEDDWRHVRGEPAATVPPTPPPKDDGKWWLDGAIGPLSLAQIVTRSIERAVRESTPLVDRTLMSAAGYLERRMRWAAEEHELFPEFSSELHDLRSRLQSTTARSDRPLRAPAVCFNCGQDALEKEWTKTGLAESWKCGRCHRVYDQAEYWLAVRARLEGAKPKPTPLRRRRPPCSSCGFHRCPHAWHDLYLCTGSDEPGQVPQTAPSAGTG